MVKGGTKIYRKMLSYKIMSVVKWFCSKLYLYFFVLFVESLTLGFIFLRMQFTIGVVEGPVYFSNSENK